jgi:hypothetical protein
MICQEEKKYVWKEWKKSRDFQCIKWA